MASYQHRNPKNHMQEREPASLHAEAQLEPFLHLVEEPRDAKRSSIAFLTFPLQLLTCLSLRCLSEPVQGIWEGSRNGIMVSEIKSIPRFEWNPKRQSKKLRFSDSNITQPPTYRLLKATGNPNFLIVISSCDQPASISNIAVRSYKEHLKYSLKGKNFPLTWTVKENWKIFLSR